jgi:hypothetical protein
MTKTRARDDATQREGGRGDNKGREQSVDDARQESGMKARRDGGGLRRKGGRRRRVGRSHQIRIRVEQVLSKFSGMLQEILG